MTFFPLGDNNPRVLVQRPWVTWSIVGACTLFFIWEKLINPDGFDARVLDFAIVPAFVSGNFEPAAAMPLPPWATLVTSLFLHVDTLHLAVNMLYLWVFGDNIEDAMGHAKFVVFYLLCGVIAGLVHVWLDPYSMAPTLGASSAVSAVLGGYLLLHPRAKVWFFPSPFALPAWFWLMAWIGFQVYAAYQTGWTGNGVAWGAHIGGFLAGLLLVIPMRRRTVPLLGPGETPSGVRFAGKPPASLDEGED